VNQSTGTLFIVSTPIGNLGDLSPRAAKSLHSAKYILCESVSHTRVILSAAKDLINLKRAEDDISESKLAPLVRYEGKGPKSDWQIQKVLADLQNGDSVALVSNAGTPLISDPGGKLAAAVVAASLPVVHIPGPAAFVSAAVTSGLPTKNILFIGFLPKKTKALAQKLAAARSSLLALNEPASLAVYVPKYQLNKTIDAVIKTFGEIIRQLKK